MKKQSSLEPRNIVNSEPAEQYRQIAFTAFVDYSHQVITQPSRKKHRWSVQLPPKTKTNIY